MATSVTLRRRHRLSYSAAATTVMQVLVRSSRRIFLLLATLNTVLAIAVPEVAAAPCAGCPPGVDGVNPIKCQQSPFWPPNGNGYIFVPFFTSSRRFAWANDGDLTQRTIPTI